MKVRTLALSLALTAMTPFARAQIVAETPSPTAPAPPAAVVATVPEAPVVPPALAARVTALARVADDTVECFTERGERTEHIADRRCGQWYAQLARGGPATAHAIGSIMERPPSEPNPLRDGEGEYRTGPRLVQLLATTRAPEAIPYMLRYLAGAARHRHDWSESSNEMFRQLARLAGEDAAPLAPWRPDDAALVSVMEHRVEAWLAWWAAHRDEAPAERAAAADARAVAALASDDVAVRFAAIQRLAANPAQRPAVEASLRGLMARADLPAPAAVYIRRWAQRARLPIAARTLRAAAL